MDMKDKPRATAKSETALITIDLGENTQQPITVQCPQGLSIATVANEAFSRLWRGPLPGEARAPANPETAPQLALITDPEMQIGLTADGGLVLKFLHPLRGWMEFLLPRAKYFQVMTALAQMQLEIRKKSGPGETH